jgi:hypothetical protein
MQPGPCVESQLSNDSTDVCGQSKLCTRWESGCQRDALPIITLTGYPA